MPADGTGNQIIAGAPPGQTVVVNVPAAPTLTGDDGTPVTVRQGDNVKLLVVESPAQRRLLEEILIELMLIRSLLGEAHDAGGHDEL